MLLTETTPVETRSHQVAETRPTDETFPAFLERAVEPSRRADCTVIAAMMEEATGESPVMWGSIVGFGRYRYKYASGREGEWPLVGFSPRKSDLTLYIMPGFDGVEQLMGRLGKFRTGKSCLYIKRLSDVEVPVLKKLIAESVRRMAPLRIKAGG